MLNRPLSHLSTSALAALLAAAVVSSARATILDDIGVTGANGVRTLDSSLIGLGVTVAQAEAPLSSSTSNAYVATFEVNPSAANGGNPQTVPITYIANATVNNTATAFPNAVGLESSHADNVAMNFYGSTTGPAPGLANVLNYDANRFVSDAFSLTPMTATIVNQSFVFTGSITTGQAAVILQLYDNYVARYSTTIVTAVGNTAGTLLLPSPAYNVISVAAVPIPGDTNFITGGGPYTDGRTKPDIAAYGEATSFATPLVSGVAAILYQAGGRGDGGAGTTTTSVDSMVIKALLLNGATKPAGWTHTSTAPLSIVTGAGIVNALNSYQNLHAGTRGPTITNTVALNSPHAAVVTGSAVGAEGWVRRSNLVSDDTHDAVDHFFIDLSAGGSLFSLNATLTWNREYNDAVAKNLPNATVSTINNLDLFLYDSSNNLVASSVSNVDNVEHFASVVLPSGKYDLQVLKHGGAVGNPNVSNDTSSYFTETYGLAWNASTINTSGTTITSPNGFFEFTNSRTVSAISGVNSVQVDAGATLSLPSLAAATVNNNGNVNFTNVNVQVISTSFSGTGTIMQSGTGTTTLTGAITGGGSISVSAGKLALGHTTAARQTSSVLLVTNGLSITGNGKFDLTNHDLLIHNGNYNTLFAKIVSGYNFGLWNGPGIITSEADAAGGTTSLGILQGSDYLDFNSPFFDGQPVVASDILIKYTFWGDITLDGLVNGDDLGIFLNYYDGSGGPGVGSYVNGDMNFDGLVNGDDLGNFLNNYTANPAPPTLGESFRLATVPEPASLMIFGIGILALGLRKFRLPRYRARAQ